MDRWPPPGAARWRWVACAVALAVTGAAEAQWANEPRESPAVPVPLLCIDEACTPAASHAFPGVVVGKVDRVVEPAAVAALFERARSEGHWSTLPPSSEAFASRLRALVVNTQDRADDRVGHPLRLLVLMMEDEYDDAPFVPGVLVRYAPHGPDHEQPPADRPDLLPYWSLSGCVLVLCTPQTANCASLYLPGVYERGTGRAVDWRTGTVTSAVPLIDPRSKQRALLAAPR